MTPMKLSELMVAVLLFAISALISFQVYNDWILTGAFLAFPTPLKVLIISIFALVMLMHFSSVIEKLQISQIKKTGERVEDGVAVFSLIIAYVIVYLGLAFIVWVLSPFFPIANVWAFTGVYLAVSLIMQFILSVFNK